MSKITNIAFVTVLYMTTFWSTSLLFTYGGAAMVGDCAKWLWGLGAMIITSLCQLMWKVHETKRIDGLSVEQMTRLRAVAEIIMRRIYFLILIVAVASVAGFFSAFVPLEPLRLVVARFALGIVVGSLVLWLVWLKTLQTDIRRFEDRARQEINAQKAADAFAARLAETEQKLLGSESG